MTLFLCTFLLFALQLLSMTLLESLFLLVDSRQFIPFVFLGTGLGAAMQLFNKTPAWQKLGERLIPVSLAIVCVAFFFTRGSEAPLIALFLAFLTLGWAIAGYFREKSLRRVYIVDMCGAIAGAAFYFLCLPYLGGERALVALLFLSLAIPWSHKLRAPIAITAFAASALAILFAAKHLPGKIDFLFTRPGIDLPAASLQNNFRNAYMAIHSGASDHIATRWSPLGRVDLLRTKENGEHWFYYNNVTFTSTNADLGDYFFPHRVLPNRESALILGSGGGNDIIQVKKLGFKNVTALEINSGTMDIMNSPYIKNFNGDLFKDDVVLNEDARAFLERRNHQFAYITSTFTELTYERNSPTIYYHNYIYTVEGTEAIWDGLLPDGVAIWLRLNEGDRFHGPDAHRTILTIREVLLRKGLDPRRHLVVVHDTKRGQSIVWLKKDGWNPEDYSTYFSNHGENNILVFPVVSEPVDLPEGAAVMRKILAEGMSADDYFREYGVRIDPVTDDRPYLYYHLAHNNWFYFYAWFALICLLGIAGTFVNLRRRLPARMFQKIVPHHVTVLGLGFAAGLLQIALTYDTAFLFVHPMYSIVCVLLVWLSGGVVASMLYGRTEKHRLLWGFVTLAFAAFLAFGWSEARLILIKMEPWIRPWVFGALIFPVAIASSSWFLTMLEDCRRVNQRHDLSAYCLSSLALVAGSGLCGFTMFHFGVRNSVYFALGTFAVSFALAGWISVRESGRVTWRRGDFARSESTPASAPH